MSKSKHTPGPWLAKIRIHKQDIRMLPAGAAHSIETSKGEGIGRVWSHKNTKASLEVCEANARLIAAAPDLLWVAKKALIDLGAANRCLGGDQTGTDPYYADTRKLLRNIIAKAEGKE